jgi:hypothetical protein
MLVSNARGGVTVLELLIRLELKRQALRRKMLGVFRQDDDGYFAVGLMVIAILLAPPTPLVIIAPAYTLGAIGIALVGAVLVLTVLLAPVGLMLL